jgi:hypothetical protein
VSQAAKAKKAASNGGDQCEDPFNDPFFDDPGQGVAVGSDDDDGTGGKSTKKPVAKAGTGNKSAPNGRVKSGNGGKDSELELLLMDDDDLRWVVTEQDGGGAALGGSPTDTASMFASCSFC